MNGKGQVGAISVVFGLIIFIILWAMFFASWISTLGAQMISENSLTGVEAFLLSNLNLWVGIGVFIGVLITLLVGARN